MDWESLSEDQIDEVIFKAEAEIASWRAVEMAAIREKRSRGTIGDDGYRSIVDWVAARADVSHQTARSITWTASRLAGAPDVETQLAGGEVTFDRAEQLARLPKEHRQTHRGLDIGQLRRKVAHYRRLSAKRERDSSIGYLNMYPSTDETIVNLWGAMPAFDSRIVEKAVDQRADEVLTGDSRLAVAERRALALVAICQDSLYDDQDVEHLPAADLAVTIDAAAAVDTGGQAGVNVLAGPRVGVQALEAILCDTVVEVTAIAEDGKPLDMGRRTRTVGRRLRRHVLDRDGGCVVEGCTSRYRLQIHHTIPWSQGGSTDAADLITLCWYHHQVAVHRLGLHIVRLGMSRVRLRRPHDPRPPPRPPPGVP